MGEIPAAESEMGKISDNGGVLGENSAGTEVGRAYLQSIGNGRDSQRCI